MILTLAGLYGEHRITPKQLHEISAERLEEFQVQLEIIAKRDGLAVEIVEQIGRGYIVRWWPANEAYPW